MDTVVLVSCGYEWKALTPLFPDARPETSPPGEWFTANGSVFLWGGFGKIAAAASAQYAIDRWRPRLLVNIGTCGGFEGEIGRGEVLLAERTVVYDIAERMTDPDAAIAHFTTVMDLSWLPACLPQPVRRATLVSADGDLDPGDIPRLKARYGAVAADWESGAIAWVAARHGVRCLILRGVSDLVGSTGGEAYSDFGVYVEGAAEVMRKLAAHLPEWIALALNPSAIAPPRCASA